MNEVVKSIIDLDAASYFLVGDCGKKARATPKCRLRRMNHEVRQVVADASE